MQSVTFLSNHYTQRQIQGLTHCQQAWDDSPRLGSASIHRARRAMNCWKQIWKNRKCGSCTEKAVRRSASAVAKSKSRILFFAVHLFLYSIRAGADGPGTSSWTSMAANVIVDPT